MSYVIPVTGFLIFIAYGAVVLNIPAEWFAASILVLLGFAALAGARMTRTKNEPVEIPQSTTQG